MTRRRVLFWFLGIVLALLLAADALLLARRARYVAEIERLRAAMTELERRRTDQLLSTERNRFRTAVELFRRQARLEPTLHLSVSVDSGIMFLERDGVELRRMRVEVGPERRIGVVPDTVRLAQPRGVRSVVRVLTDSMPWDVPPWVYADRGVAPPPRRGVAGALGPAAILLDGGTVIYAMPAVGPLNDSGYVLPGSVRAEALDLHAILPNLTPGVRVFFY